MQQRYIIKSVFVWTLLCCSCSKQLTDVPGGDTGHKQLPFSIRLENWNNEGSSSLGASKSAVLDENMISDLNILVFNAAGAFLPEQSIYCRSLDEAKACVDPELEYTILMIANAGEDIRPKVASEGTLEKVKSNFRICIFSYADGFKGKGMPLTGSVHIKNNGTTSIPITLKRLYSKWVIDIDCTQAVHSSFKIHSMKLCNAPVAYYPFRDESRIESEEDSSGETAGDFATGNDIHLLDSSGKVVLYLLENIQGAKLLPSNVQGSAGKTAQALRNEGYDKLYKYSYIEMGVSAATPTATYPNAVYKAYLGENMTDNFNIARNKAYYLTLRIADEDVHSQQWRVNPGIPGENYGFTTDKAWIGIIKGKGDSLAINSTSKTLLELLTVSQLYSEDPDIYYNMGDCIQTGSAMYQRVLTFNTDMKKLNNTAIKKEEFSAILPPKESRFRIAYKGGSPSMDVSIYSFNGALPLQFIVKNHRLYLGTVEHAPRTQCKIELSGDVKWQHMNFVRSGLIRKDVIAEALTPERSFDYSRTLNIMYDEEMGMEAFYTGIDFSDVVNLAQEDLNAVSGYSDTPEDCWRVNLSLDCKDIDDEFFYMANKWTACDTPVVQTPYYIGWGDSDSYVGDDRGSIWYQTRHKINAVPIYDTMVEISYQRLMANFNTSVYMGDYLYYNGKRVFSDF